MTKYKTSLEYEGVELYVEYYYYKAESGGMELPSYPDSVEIQDVKVLDTSISIIFLLLDEQIKDIELIILNQHQQA
jgi:hypothetical protein